MNDGTDELSQDNYSYAYVDDGSVRANGSNVDTGEATYAANDIVMVAMDITNSKLYFGKNGTWINSGDPTSGSTGTGAYSIQPVASTLTGCYHFAAGDWVNPGTNTWSANFGNGFLEPRPWLVQELMLVITGYLSTMFRRAIPRYQRKDLISNGLHNYK